MSPLLPCPEEGNGTDTPIPTPAEISAALSMVGAEQVAPGVWTAKLSIGVTIRITDPPPAPPQPPPAADDEDDVEVLALEYTENELDHDRVPTTAGFQEWLRSRGKAVAR